ILFICIFFFSSRRRHTRSKRDWSSDVCSSDLSVMNASGDDKPSVNLVCLYKENKRFELLHAFTRLVVFKTTLFNRLSNSPLRFRSEECRVGKECRSGWSVHQYKQGHRKRSCEQ